MDRYNCPKCKALEEAIDAMGIPAHVEVNDGILQITILGTSPVTLKKSLGGTTVKVTSTPGWDRLGEEP
jgi:hypothetical protein